MDKYEEVTDRIRAEALIRDTRGEYRINLTKVEAILRESFPQAEASEELDGDLLIIGRALAEALQLAKGKPHITQWINDAMAARSRLAARPAPTTEKALREAAQFAYDRLTTFEINTSNYTHDDVCRLERLADEAYRALKQALAHEAPKDDLCSTCAHRHDSGCSEDVARGSITMCSDYEAPKENKIPGSGE